MMRAFLLSFFSQLLEQLSSKMEFVLILALLATVSSETATDLGIQERVMELGAKLRITCPSKKQANSTSEMLWMEKGSMVTRKGYTIEKSASGYNTLTIDRLQESDNGTICFCFENTHDGSGYASVIIQVTVLATDDLPRGFPMIESGSKSDEARVQHPDSGDVVRLPCYVSGDPQPQVGWHKDSARIDWDDKRYSLSSSNDLFIRNVRPKDSGVYECAAYNEHGTAFSKPLELRVKEPEDTTAPLCIIFMVVCTGIFLACINVYLIIAWWLRRREMNRFTDVRPLITNSPPHSGKESDSDWDQCKP